MPIVYVVVLLMPMIEVPDKLYDEAEENLEEEGFNSVSELVRYQVRRWNE